jgi:hypothetical protein
VLSILGLVAGMLLLLGSGVGAITVTGGAMASAQALTAPTDEPVRLTVRPGTAVVWQERAGTHVTLNRPLLDVPADLTIRVEDDSGTPIPTRAYQWRVSQEVFGMKRERRAVAAFESTGQPVRIAIASAGMAYPQTYSVGPAVDRAWNRVAAYLAVMCFGGVALMCAGVFGLIRASASRDVGSLLHD